MSETLLRRELAELARTLHERGWVANHDGNVSVRLPNGGFLATPTAVSKGVVNEDMLVVLDADGKVVAGNRKVFSEISLHLAVFRARPEVSGVVHAHPPTATGFAVTGRSCFDPPFLAEAVVSLGERIPVVPYAAPGTSTDALSHAFADVDAALLGNHGVLTCGPDAETAFLRMELVEHLARIALVAQQLGGPTPLPSGDVAKLLEARAKAGLGPAGRASSQDSWGGGGPAPLRNASPGAWPAGPLTPAGGPGGARPDLAALVKDALGRF